MRMRCAAAINRRPRARRRTPAATPAVLPPRSPPVLPLQLLPTYRPPLARRSGSSACGMQASRSLCACLRRTGAVLAPVWSEAMETEAECSQATDHTPYQPRTNSGSSGMRACTPSCTLAAGKLPYYPPLHYRTTTLMSSLVRPRPNRPSDHPANAAGGAHIMTIVKTGAQKTPAHPTH